MLTVATGGFYQSIRRPAVLGVKSPLHSECPGRGSEWNRLVSSVSGKCKYGCESLAGTLTVLPYCPISAVNSVSKYRLTSADYVFGFSSSLLLQSTFFIFGETAVLILQATSTRTHRISTNLRHLT